jgi:cytochrome oxidase assembly protein ShyY1
VAVVAALALAGVIIASAASYLANVRIFRATEAGLATLRTNAFRHVHDLSVLSQNSQRRGTLVARVTTDVDTISAFVQFGGLMLVLTEPAARLEQSAPPSIKDVPNNHLAYAVQWFIFAADAAIIYGLALYRRRRA